MATITLVTGLLLVVLGVGAYVFSGLASVTALIPAMFGAIIAACGGLAARPRWHNRSILAAAVVAILGVFGALGRIVPELFSADGVQWNLAAGTQVAMAVISLAFVVAWIVWLARRKKTGGAVRSDA